jgi:hypothetical protein
VKLLRLATVLLVALSMGAALGHALEMPAKLALDGTMWLTLQQTLYAPGWGTFGAAFEAGAVISAPVLAFLLRHRRPAFAWTALGAACMLAAHAAFWILLDPINAEIAAASPESPAAHWASLRAQWEYTHAARAGLQLAALGFLVQSILSEERA